MLLVYGGQGGVWGGHIDALTPLGDRVVDHEEFVEKKSLLDAGALPLMRWSRVGLGLSSCIFKRAKC